MQGVMFYGNVRATTVGGHYIRRCSLYLVDDNGSTPVVQVKSPQMHEVLV